MTTVKIEINIDKICEKLNISKLGLARLLEVSPKTIFNWQNGDSHPTFKHLQRLSKETGFEKLSEFLK